MTAHLPLHHMSAAKVPSIIMASEQSICEISEDEVSEDPLVFLPCGHVFAMSDMASLVACLQLGLAPQHADTVFTYAGRVHGAGGTRTLTTGARPATGDAWCLPEAGQGVDGTICFAGKQA